MTVLNVQCMWIKAIELVVSEKQIGKGHGGKNEDDECYDLEPDI